MNRARFNSYLFDPNEDMGWQRQAACLGVDPELFFPERGAHNERAKEICARCPVRAECLSYAQRTNQRAGIWGGLSGRQRRELRGAA